MTLTLNYVCFVCCALTTKIVTTTNESSVTYVTSKQVKEIATAYQDIIAWHANQIRQEYSNTKRGPRIFRLLKLFTFCAAVIQDHLRSISRLKTLEHLFMFPGTQWCGNGNRSEHEDDLGPLRGTDRCCRDHDHSVEYTQPLSRKHGIVNTRLWPMMKCEDDQKFYDCLLNDNSESKLMSACVGMIYFDFLGTQCFEKAYTVTCVESVRRLLHEPTCRKFKIDTSKPTWKLSDSKSFLDAYLRKP